MMCFYHDGDDSFTPTVWNKASADQGKAMKCHECGHTIAENEWRLAIHAQEFDGCKICEDDTSPSFIDPDDCTDEERKILAEHKCDSGDVFDYVRCRDCDNLLKAIEAVETDAGCPSHARRPCLLELQEAMEDDGKRYAVRALEMFPELAEHRFVKEAMGE